jgi:hypothetical protein
VPINYLIARHVVKPYCGFISNLLIGLGKSCAGGPGGSRSAGTAEYRPIFTYDDELKFLLTPDAERP